MNRILKSKIIEKFGSQADFAIAVGETEPAISRVVRNRRTLTPEKKQVWAKALKSEPSKLFNHKGVM